MKIHFASGTHPFGNGWMNIDANDYPGVDKSVDLLAEFPDFIKNIEVAYVGHFLEHLTKDECVEFLSKVRERTLSGGQLIIVGPDVEKGENWFARGKIGKDLLASIHKHGEIPQNESWNRAEVHVWDCTGHEVVDLCKISGWDSAVEIPIGQMKDAPMIDSSGWQFCVVATA